MEVRDTLMVAIDVRGHSDGGNWCRGRSREGNSSISCGLVSGQSAGE